MGVSLCAFRCEFMCVHACGGQSSMSNVCFSFPDLAQVFQRDQCTPGILPFLSPQSWDCRHMLLCLGLHGGRSYRLSHCKKKKKGSLGILDALHSYEQKMISLSTNKKDAIHVLIGVSLHSAHLYV